VFAGLLFATRISASAGAPAETAHEVQFTFLASGNFSGVEAPAFTQARNPAQLRQIQTLFNAHASDVGGDPWPVPQVDFSKHVLIAFFAGGGDSCFWYHISRVLEFPDRLTVEVSHQVWGHGVCTCGGTAITSWAVIVVPATTKAIDYVIRPKPLDCRS
jgi:hypothetical protein